MSVGVGVGERSLSEAYRRMEGERRVEGAGARCGSKWALAINAGSQNTGKGVSVVDAHQGQVGGGAF